ncbi:RHS repeat-associated core domain-containing protein [Bacillus carboniphilus]|uniref:RHS repeat-associated core domain-containing protein n=1 Tax=Bacillus carboniphilus TaxID=86663 RepID=A0ABY9JSK9_9BACI|nr:RHS repeat-associated core domain-containing protein [Bacillus carboniphilus]WLR41723.1 RHS repeat-associated core domain-containing protein [Bacillus carboniphilus]
MIQLSLFYKVISSAEKEAPHIGVTVPFRANRLDSVEQIMDGQDPIITQNFYNGDGQRIEKKVNGTSWKYMYDRGNLLYTSDNNHNKATEHVLDPYGGIVTSKRFDGNYKNNYFFYHYDMRGSVTSILKPTGERVKGYDYDEFGNLEEVGDKSFLNEVKFTGAVHDQSTGLHYMNARHYNSNTGRFISQDTYKGVAHDPWSQHLYSYTTNNPVNYIDPTGHAPAYIGHDGKAHVAIPVHQGDGTFTWRAPYAEKSKSAGDWIQNGLDVLGMAGSTPMGASPIVQGIALGADLLNAGIFLAKGEFKNAGLTAASAVPYLDYLKAGRATNSFVKNGTKSSENVVYRALNQKDAERVSQGLGLEAKNPNGTWGLKEHLVSGSSRSSWANDPFISTTTDKNIARGFNNSGSNLGIAKIDLNKVPSQNYKGYEIYPRQNGKEGLPYHYSIWQQEISIYQSIPNNAIKGFVK